MSSQVHDRKIQLFHHLDVSLVRIRINIPRSVRMESFLGHTLEYHLQSRRVRQPEYPHIGTLRRRAHNRECLPEGSLVPRMSVQVQRGHETRLRRMRMYPTKRNQPPCLLEIQNQLFFDHLTRIARRALARDQQRRDRKPARSFLAQQQAAGLAVLERIGFGDGHEFLNRFFWQ